MVAMFRITFRRATSSCLVTLDCDEVMAMIVDQLTAITGEAGLSFTHRH